MEVAEEERHELVRVMLHDWLEPPSYGFFEELDFYNSLPLAEHVFVEKVQPVAVAEVVSLGSDALVLGVLLTQVVVAHLLNRNEALHECVEIAVVADVPNADYSVRQIMQVLVEPLVRVLVPGIRRHCGLHLSARKV